MVKGLGVKMRFNVVICKENVNELADIVNLAKRLDVSTINFKAIDLVGQTDDMANGVSSSLLRELKRADQNAKTMGIKTNANYLIRNYEQYKLKYSGLKDIDRSVKCFLPWFMIYIKVNGDMAPCCPFALSDVNYSIGKDINSEEAQKFRKDMNRGINHKICKFCFEGQTISNLLINAKMLRYFLK